MHQVPVVLEDDSRLLQYAAPFYIDCVVSVYQNVVDCRVLKQRFKRTKTEDFIQHLLRQPVSFRCREGNVLLPNQLVNHRQQLLLGSWILVHQRDLFQIQTLDQPVVYCGLDFLLDLEGYRSRRPHNRRNGPRAPIDHRISHGKLLDRPPLLIALLP